MHKLDFLRLRAVGKWVPVREGDQICNTKSARESLFILVQGRIHASFRYEDHADLTMHAAEKQYCSGDVFDYRALNAFGVFVGSVWLGLYFDRMRMRPPTLHEPCQGVGACLGPVLSVCSSVRQPRRYGRMSPSGSPTRSLSATPTGRAWCSSCAYSFRSAASALISLSLSLSYSVSLSLLLCLSLSLTLAPHPAHHHHHHHHHHHLARLVIVNFQPRCSGCGTVLHAAVWVLPWRARDPVCRLVRA